MKRQRSLSHTEPSGSWRRGLGDRPEPLHRLCAHCLRAADADTDEEETYLLVQQAAIS